MMARKNHVIIISLPPHTSHKLQPLDCSYIRPLKTYFSEEVRLFLREFLWSIEMHEVTQLLSHAYIKIAQSQLLAVVSIQRESIL